MQIDKFLISNNLADLTQTIYITNNVTRLELINTFIKRVYSAEVYW